MRSPDRPEAAALRADAPAVGERRALAARLLRLPDGHPSSPQGDGAEGDWQSDAADEEPWWPADQAVETEGAAYLEDPDYAADAEDAGDPDDLGDPGGQGGPDQPGLDPPGGPEPTPRAAGRPSAGGARDGREPYRPWFADGAEPGDPWFADGL
jgi:hypothetical protein